MLNSYIVDKERIGGILKEHTGQDIKITVYMGSSQQDLSIMFINEINGVTDPVILTGFNSSSGKRQIGEYKPIGFDFPLIAKRSGIRAADKNTLVYGGKLFGSSKNTIRIAKNDCIPKAYICDMQLLISDDLTPKESKALNRFNLDSYLQLFGLSTKIEQGYRAMNERLLADTNIDDILAYCLNDCYSLHLINEKRNVFAKVIARA